LGFYLEPGLELGMRILGRIKQHLYAGKSAPGRRGTRLNGFVGTVEIIPRERLHVRAENQVCVTLPYFELMFLSSIDGAADDLKDVGRGATSAVFDTDGNSDHMFGTKIARSARWNRRNQTAIGQAAGSNLNGFEQAREGATRSDSFRQISMGKNNRFTGSQVRRDYCHRNLEILETPRFEHLLDEVAQAVVASQAQTGNTPARDIAKTDCAASGNDASERSTAGVSRAENAADARASNVRNRDLILLEDLQHTEMREPARESAA
jgi:hypothetical protein